MKFAEINLPYFKQGDDFYYAKENSKNDIEALQRHADMLRTAAQQLDIIRNKIEEMNAFDKVKIDGDTHMISIEAPDEIIDNLLKEKLVYVWDEEECDDEE